MNFDLEEHYKKDEMKMLVDLPWSEENCDNLILFKSLIILYLKA